jgi:uncharacterized membrane protein YecN with MAPEG domain
MNLPITSVLAGFMALLIMVLNAQYSARQIQLGGDVFQNMTGAAGDDILTRRRIAFFSAVFNIPMSVLLLALIEFKGSSTLQVIILASTLVVSRLLHVIGCFYETLPQIRTFATTIQFGYYTVCGIWLMSGLYYLI